MSANRLRSSSSSSNSFAWFSASSSVADRFCSISSSSSMAAVVFLPAVDEALRPRALFRPRPRPLDLLVFFAVVAGNRGKRWVTRRTAIAGFSRSCCQLLRLQEKNAPQGAVTWKKKKKSAPCFDSCGSRKANSSFAMSLGKYEIVTTTYELASALESGSAISRQKIFMCKREEKLAGSLGGPTIPSSVNR